MEYFSLPPCNAFVVNLQLQFLFLCASLAPIRITNSSKEYIQHRLKLGMDGDEAERREKKMVKLAVCDGSRPYRKTQLSLLTRQLISGYCGIFT